MDSELSMNDKHNQSLKRVHAERERIELESIQIMRKYFNSGVRPFFPSDRKSVTIFHLNVHCFLDRSVTTTRKLTELCEA